MKYQYNFLDDMIVDSFAGGGGASTGIELALGRVVDVAINHDINAIKMHEANHPWTQHYCENIFKVDPIKVTQGRSVGLMWASPDCTHFSKAKGGKPVKKEIRGLAWVVVQWAAAVRPRVIMLENVPEFQTWGPIDKKGKPIKTRAGETFNQFVAHLRNLGYAVEWRVLDASDYGAGTCRKRLHLIARCDSEPIIWPKPTHGVGLKPKHTAAEYIDFTVRGRSIFNRKKPLAEATLRRIARGVDKFTIRNDKPFLIKNTVPHITKYFSGEYQAGSAADAPLDTITAIDHNGLVAANLIQYHGEGGGENRAYGVDAPIKTIDTNPRYGLATANLVQYYSNGRAVDIEKPLPTTTTKDRMAFVKNSIVKYAPGADLKNWPQVRELLNKYVGYNIADNEVLILEIDGVQYFINDIELRMLLPRELYGCQGFPQDYIIDRTSDGKMLSIAEQIKKVGNSVCPPVACALAAANCSHLIRAKKPLSSMQELRKAVAM